MTSRRRLLAAAGAWLLALSQGALAHTRSESYMVVDVAGPKVHIAVTLPKLEAAKLAPDAPGGPSNDRVSTYVAERVAVTSGGAACPASPPATSMAPQDMRRVEITFACAGERSLSLRTAVLFDLVKAHVAFVHVRRGDGSFVEQLLTADRAELDLSEGGGGKLESAGFFEYVRLGIEHILTGPDHLAFVLGFVLISRRFRDLVFVITGFTIGHSITLALAVTGVVRPHTAFIDVLIALTIALIGAENVALASKRPFAVAAGAGALLLAMALARMFGYGSLPVALLLGAGLFAFCYLMSTNRLHDAARARLVVTLIFGLIHGFAFAKDLIEMRLPPKRLGELLFGFNLGVEIGQLLVVAVLTGLAFALMRFRLALPRPITVDVTASALVCLGVFWIVSRTYS